MAITESRNGALDQRLALDVQSVDALRNTVRNSPDEGVKQVSRQFEALFMNMVLKSMREATPSSGLLENRDQKIYLSMLDQQLAQNLSGRGVGLAEAMFAQLSRAVAAGDADGDGASGLEGLSLAPRGAMALPGASAAGMPFVPPPGGSPTLPSSGVPFGSSPPPGTGGTPGAAATTGAVPRSASAAPVDLGIYQRNSDAPSPAAVATLQGKVDGFVQRMGASAQVASAASGVPAPLILAQAALESGWGKREIRADDGTQSFNLFGIKADRSWKGPVVETTTTEYVDGEPQRVRAKFRAYGSYDEAFTDYARFITRNPRYANVLAAETPAEAAHGLQKAGYATDPQYGQKLVRIMQKFS